MPFLKHYKNTLLSFGFCLLSVVLLICIFFSDTFPYSLSVFLNPLFNFFNLPIALSLTPILPILGIYFACRSKKLKESIWAGTVLGVIGLLILVWVICFGVLIVTY